MCVPHAESHRTSFPTELGWMAMVGQGRVLRRLVFGYASACDAEKALGPNWLEGSRWTAWNVPLRRRLQRYAAGERVEFDDLPVDLDSATDFGRRVFLVLREVRYGQTTTYGQLAARAGAPKASRAVGTLMAQNAIPLVLPCHRVVRADKHIGNYSAPGGAAVKRLLLQAEMIVQP